MADNSNKETEKSESLIRFPCDFPIKILGKGEFEFESSVMMILRQHFPQLSEGSIQLKPSENGKYLSITATLYVENQKQLDNVYQALVDCEKVIMVL